MIFTLLSIWISLAWGLVILFSAVHFWFKHSDFRVDTSPLPYYPKVTIVVPAHNEDVVIAQTTKAILDMNYPHDCVELLLFADNCSDNTYEECLAVKAMPEYAERNITVINRSGTGGKAGVLNDALKMAKGDYICVYDADAMPEKNALYFLAKEIVKDPERHVASFGRNKTRNANQNFLTRCINQEIVVTQRVHHVGMWHLFKIGRIPGTNFMIQTEFVKSIGGWKNGALTEDTDISFKTDKLTNKELSIMFNKKEEKSLPILDLFSRNEWDGKTLKINTSVLNDILVKKNKDQESDLDWMIFTKDYRVTFHFNSDIKKIEGKHDLVRKVNNNMVEIKFNIDDVRKKGFKFKNDDSFITIATK